MAESCPDRIDLQLQVARAITSMTRTRYQISKDQKKSLKAAMTKVLQEVAILLGIGVGMGMGMGLKAGGS